MPHRARPLHVVALAPVAALSVVALAPSTHARAAGQDQPPAPYVVAIDAGHGGSPDNNHPDQLFDPGAVAGNGLMEKDLALDMARRVRALLQQDYVKVVLTRDSDVYLDIGPRMQTAIDAGAQLFVSIHFNSFADSGVNGSVVLYPGDQSLPFAKTMSDALARGLAPFGVSDDGVLLRDNLWVHATMPAVTVEPMYLSNAHEADLMTRTDVRDRLAQAIRDGVEEQDPTIATRKQAILRWAASHTLHTAPPAAGIGGVAVTAGSTPALRIAVGLLLLAMAAFLLRRRLPAMLARPARVVVATGRRGRASAPAAVPRRRRDRVSRPASGHVAPMRFGTLAVAAPSGGAAAALWSPRSPRRPGRAGEASSPMVGPAALVQGLRDASARVSGAVRGGVPDGLVLPDLARPTLRLGLPLGEGARRRRRAARRRSLVARARPTPTRTSVYDELWF